ncbi:MAG: pyruvate kinase [Elusimicrobia bacterium RIFOXYB2_FULL_49_7]|nr:MAG: pyruvate kinase [Elusimicrobia bacterium RIFOXYB2_FULL_49_7]
MKLPLHKTKIVATIGPASRSVAVLEALINEGMNIARLNFSHGSPDDILESIGNIRAASRKAGRIVTIFADLPGKKIRIGILPHEPMLLSKGDHVTLTVRNVAAEQSLIPVEYKQLMKSVKKGSIIYLNDGFIQMQADEVSATDARCTVLVGGTLLSRKGLNLPGAKLAVDPVTDRDLELIKFGLENGIDTYAVSFIEKAGDILKVKKFAAKLGRQVYTVAKIERREAIENFDAILAATDAVMIARGDLGVEIPLEEVPSIQKQLIAKANLYGKPVITATQMLESMKSNTRPTRAEVSDVANAILDGTDAVMLSEETAIGKYPVETVRMMASIAATTERRNARASTESDGLRWSLNTLAGEGRLTIPDVISRNVVVAAEALHTRYVITPTDTGSTARRVSRYKPDSWILAFSIYENTCRFLAFSYGVYAFLMDKSIDNLPETIMGNLETLSLTKKGDKVIFTEGRFSHHPGGTDSLYLLTVGQEMKAEPSRHK